MLPKFINSRGVAFDVVFCNGLTLSALLGSFDTWLGGSGVFFACVGHTVDSRLNLAASNGDVHCAILLADTNIGEGEGLPAYEFLDLSSVAGAVWREVDSVERSKRPVAGKESLLILGRKFRSGPKGYARG